MNTVKVCDSTVRKLSSGKDISLSFKEKIEVAKLLDKLCVDVIELDEIRNSRVDSLLIKSVATAVKYSKIAVPVALGADPADTASACRTTPSQSLITTPCQPHPSRRTSFNSHSFSQAWMPLT